MKIHKHYDDVYMVAYQVVMDATIDEFYKYIEDSTGEKVTKDDVKPWNCLFEGLELGRELQCFILLNEGDLTIRSLSHEVAHAVSYVFNIRGIPINIENDEAFCWYYDYLLEHLKTEDIK